MGAPATRFKRAFITGSRGDGLKDSASSGARCSAGDCDSRRREKLEKDGGVAGDFVNRRICGRQNPAGAQRVGFDFLLIESSIRDGEYAVLADAVSRFDCEAMRPEGYRRLVQVARVIESGLADEFLIFLIGCGAGRGEAEQSRERRILQRAQHCYIDVAHSRRVRREFAQQIWRSDSCNSRK
jgi:hypothetical protein